MRALWLCGFVAVSMAVSAQELASIRPSPPAAPNQFGFPARTEIRVLPAGGIQASRATLVDLVRRAYDLQPFQVEGGPDWARTVSYDLTARGDLKLILSERFALRTRGRRGTETSIALCTRVTIAALARRFVRRRRSAPAPPGTAA